MLKTSQPESQVTTLRRKFAVVALAIYWRPSMGIDLRQVGGWGMKSS